MIRKRNLSRQTGMRKWKGPGRAVAGKWFRAEQIQTKRSQKAALTSNLSRKLWTKVSSAIIVVIPLTVQDQTRAHSQCIQPRRKTLVAWMFWSKAWRVIRCSRPQLLKVSKILARSGLWLRWQRPMIRMTKVKNRLLLRKARSRSI